MSDEIKALVERGHRKVMIDVALGKWLSAALDDPSVCEEMKADVRAWFSSGEPLEEVVAQQAVILTAQADEIERLKKALTSIVDDCEADYPPSHGALKYTALDALKAAQEVKA